jgi:hypothetical protein
MSTDTESIVKIVSELAGVVSVVFGTVMSVKSFNAAREKEAEARYAEAVKPFRELRQKRYLEAIRVAAVLSNHGLYEADEIKTAKKRFRELYVAELSMVETKAVAEHMIELAKTIDPELVSLTPAQTAALDLAHALRDSYVALEEPDKDEVHLSYTSKIKSLGKMLKSTMAAASRRGKSDAGK